MAQEIDSGALTGVNEAYGLSGIDAEQQTFLDDGSVSQVLAVQPIARRSRSPISLALAGQFWSVFRNVHPGAGELLSFADPYSPVNPANGWPVDFPQILNTEWDVWLVGLSALAGATTGGNVADAFAAIDVRPAQQMFSDLAAGGPITPGGREVMLGAWNDFTTIANVSGDYGLTPAGVSHIPLKIRWPRGGSPLTFRSEASGAVSVDLWAQWQVTPAMLGQDVW